METLQMKIDENLKELRGTKMQSHSSITCLQQTSRQLTPQQEKEFRTFMLNNSPAVQSDFAQSPVNCLFGSYPSMQELRSHYGKNAPIVWLIPQLKDLSEFCGVKDKMLNEQLQSCAKVIATEFGYLKTSELMLFFHLFKAGRYGQFYGAVDPMKITTSPSSTQPLTAALWIGLMNSSVTPSA